MFVLLISRFDRRGHSGASSRTVELQHDAINTSLPHLILACASSLLAAFHANLLRLRIVPAG
jgi:hypothetical protein